MKARTINIFCCLSMKISVPDSAIAYLVWDCWLCVSQFALILKAIVIGLLSACVKIIRNNEKS